MYDPHENRCTFTYRDQRRCRMLCAPDHHSLCLHHLRQACKAEGLLPPKPQPAMPVDTKLDSPRAIRRAVKRALRSFASAEITPRQAEVIARFLRLLLACGQPRRREAARKLGRLSPAGMASREAIH